MQSWGHDSKFGRRDSLDFPTKSGILGLICCARGVSDGQTDWLSKCSCLDMQVVSYCRKNSRGDILRQPMLEDFHMVGSGYNDKDLWESLMIPKTSEGKKAVGGGSKITHRYYLQDMACAVAFQVPDTMVSEVSNALQSPTWDLYLGRKSCVPTDFIYQGIFDNAEDALAKAEELAKEKNLAAYSRVLQGAHDGELVVLNDVPVRMGQRKLYRDRQVTVQRIVQDSIE